MKEFSIALGLVLGTLFRGFLMGVGAILAAKLFGVI